MKTKTRLLGSILICLLILASIAGGFWYWYDNNVDRSGWREKDGIRFYQDFHADPVSGWLTLEDGTYYFMPGGIPHTGWLTQDASTHYFTETGTMQTGWLSLDGTTYYMDSAGAMVTGWLQLDGNTHYFGGNGSMVEGWLWLDRQYYFRDGCMVYGWQTIDEYPYYFDENGCMALDFTQIEGSTYYFGTDGIMRTGLIQLEDKTYNFQDSGIMYTGWEELESGSRYFHEDGTMAIGWTEIDGKSLYFNEEGIQQHSGWLVKGEYRYYIHEDGSHAVGPTVIDGETHYFSPKGIEVILVNAMNPVPDYYERELVTIEENHQVDSRCYDALVQMLSDCNAAGIEYDFNSGYRTLNTQINILEYRTLEHMRDFDMTFQEAREKALDTVAIPGTSEHHLGLAVDLLGTEAVAWLTEHCWEYGFIVRYTEEKEPITGIIDEPWHFRYVGTEVSLDMKDTGLCLEEYLGAPAVNQAGIEAIHGDKWYREEFIIIDEKTAAQILNPEAAPAA